MIIWGASYHFSRSKTKQTIWKHSSNEVHAKAWFHHYNETHTYNVGGTTHEWATQIIKESEIRKQSMADGIFYRYTHRYLWRKCCTRRQYHTWWKLLQILHRSNNKSVNQVLYILNKTLTRDIIITVNINGEIGSDRGRSDNKNTQIARERQYHQQNIKYSNF